MKWEIGQKIKHGPAYGMTCSERFHSTYSDGDDKFEITGRASEPTPMFPAGESYVVGLRMAIMGNFKYKASWTRRYEGYGYEEKVPAVSSGKREECLVCVRDIKKFRPYLVRKRDVLQFQIETSWFHLRRHV